MADKKVTLPEISAEEINAIVGPKESESFELPADLSDMPNITEADVAEANATIADRKKYENRPLATAALSALDTASFSALGRMLDKSGIMSSENQEKLMRYNSGAETAGTVAGVVVPALFTGGTSAAAQGGAKGAAMGAAKFIPATAAVKGAAGLEKIVEKAVQKGIDKKLAKSVIQKSVEHSVTGATGVLKNAGAGLRAKTAAKAVQGATEGVAFNVGHLAREEALGRAEFNAENLADAVGTGALFGGVMGASLPVLGKGIGEASDAGKKLFGKVAHKYMNPADDAVHLSGMTPSEVYKLSTTQTGKDLLADLPRFYREEAGLQLMDGADEILYKVERVRDLRGQKIGELMKQVDAEADIILPDLATRKRYNHLTYHNMADEIERELIKPYAGMHSFQSALKRARQIAQDFRNQANSGKPISASQLWDMRKKMDELVVKFYDTSDTAIANKAALKARGILKTHINSFAEKINPNLAKELVQANQVYHTAETLLKSLNKKALKNEGLFTFQNAVWGTIGYSVGQTVGLAAAAAKNFVGSDFKRKLTILSGLEKANLQVSKKISDSVTEFLKGGKTLGKSARPTSISVLANSSLALKREEDKKPEKPKDKKEAFKNVSKNVVEFSANPGKLMEHAIRAGAGIAYAAPNTATAMGETMVKAVQFLHSKLPKDRNDMIAIGLRREYQPSSMELAKFERYMQVIEKPTSVLDDLKNGTLTREHVEALKAVYPDMYQRVYDQIMNGLQNEDLKLSYNQRVQLGMLMDIPTDPSLAPKSVLNLQANFIEEDLESEEAEGAAPVTVGGAKELDMASRGASENQAFLERRNEG